MGLALTGGTLIGARLFGVGYGITAPGSHPMGLPREMELLNDCGLTPMQVIMAATKRAADVIGQGETLGTLEAGKLADAIVIDGDPPQNINKIKNLCSVVQNGNVIDPNALTING